MIETQKIENEAEMDHGFIHEQSFFLVLLLLVTMACTIAVVCFSPFLQKILAGIYYDFYIWFKY